MRQAGKIKTSPIYLGPLPTYLPAYLYGYQSTYRTTSCFHCGTAKQPIIPRAQVYQAEKAANRGSMSQLSTHSPHGFSRAIIRGVINQSRQ
jgi:hypothetical protein